MEKNQLLSGRGLKILPAWLPFSSFDNARKPLLAKGCAPFPLPSPLTPCRVHVLTPPTATLCFNYTDLLTVLGSLFIFLLLPCLLFTLCYLTKLPFFSLFYILSFKTYIRKLLLQKASLELGQLSPLYSLTILTCTYPCICLFFHQNVRSMQIRTGTSYSPSTTCERCSIREF